MNKEYTRVSLHGEYSPQEFHLGPRSNDLSQASGIFSSSSNTGYNIISPFLCDNGRRVLVNRGWVQINNKNKSREGGIATLDGIVRHGEQVNITV